ncbi:MAG: hypothetical protein J7M12_01020, partial [Candidatus Hydrogenedentes bacterium]|nr:hypothetical protein [Candidatus Hydrogenedentota bacterium]
FGALYPLTQIYQIESDAAAGDLTLAVFLGRKVSLVVSAVCAVAAFLCFAGSVGGFGIRGFVPLVPGALFWGILLAVWLAGKVRREKKGMYRALYAWALTDMGLVTAFLVFGTGAGRL